jgi:hypothetical protein
MSGRPSLRPYPRCPRSRVGRRWHPHRQRDRRLCRRQHHRAAPRRPYRRWLPRCVRRRCCRNAAHLAICSSSRAGSPAPLGAPALGVSSASLLLQAGAATHTTRLTHRKKDFITRAPDDRLTNRGRVCPSHATSQALRSEGHAEISCTNTQCDRPAQSVTRRAVVHRSPTGAPRLAARRARAVQRQVAFTVTVMFS